MVMPRAKPRNLGRADWIRAARLALLDGGPDAVRVEPLARKLRVSKGSFYWHFKNRQELLEFLLREWEQERGALFAMLTRAGVRRGLDDFFRELQRRVTASERGESPSDAAIFSWAAVSPRVARRANAEEEERIRMLKKVFRHDQLAEVFYLAFLGFLLRRRRVPQSAAKFPVLVNVVTALLLDPPAGLKPQPAKGMEDDA